MPGELERLIIAVLSPKPSTDQKAVAAVVLQYDRLNQLTAPAPTMDLAPSNVWGTARWSECLWG